MRSAVEIHIKKGNKTCLTKHLVKDAFYIMLIMG